MKIKWHRLGSGESFIARGGQDLFLAFAGGTNYEAEYDGEIVELKASSEAAAQAWAIKWVQAKVRKLAKSWGVL